MKPENGGWSKWTANEVLEDWVYGVRRSSPKIWQKHSDHGNVFWYLDCFLTIRIHRSTETWNSPFFFRSRYVSIYLWTSRFFAHFCQPLWSQAPSGLRPDGAWKNVENSKMDDWNMQKKTWHKIHWIFPLDFLSKLHKIHSIFPCDFLTKLHTIHSR